MKNVLVVDDEKIIRDLLYDMITRYGQEKKIPLKVNCAEGYDSALERFIRGKSYDLSIVDLKLSNKPNARNGFDLVKAIRMIEEDSKVVVCSAFSRDKQVDIDQYNLNGYIQKPVDYATLCEVLDDLIP